MAKNKYTCKDCIFFEEGMCRRECYGWNVSYEDPVCTDFEYKDEFKN